MKAKGRPLTAAGVRSVTKSGSYGDGRGGYGLRLVVRKRSNGRVAKYWVQRVRIDGRLTNIGLGVYPVVALAEARRAALANVREINAGRDPRDGGIPTLREAVEKLIAHRRPGWKTARTEAAWRNTFTHAASIMDKPVDKITTGDLLGIVGPLSYAKPSVARTLRERSSAVFKLAIASGWRNDDPAGPPLVAVLPTNGGRATEHFKAVPAVQVADLIRQVREADTGLSVKLLIEFLAVTCVRTNEARCADWSEINTAAKVWTIPADRMKNGRAHRVPLSATALDVLAEARRITDGHGWVFPGRDRGPVGLGGPSRVFRKLGAAGTVHGLRSSFRDWAGEAGVAREVAEACLSHQVGSAVERSYARSDLFERRRTVMDAWAEYLDL